MRRPRVCTSILLACVLACGAAAGCTSTDASPPEPSDVALLFPPPLPAPAETPLAAVPAAALQRVLDDVVAESERFSVSARGSVGITAAVVGEAGSWSGSAGVDATGVPLAADSTMGIGGVSKTFVAAELMHLAAAGTIDLDRPAADYVTHPLLGDDVSARQLMGMRGGIRDAEVDRAVLLLDPARTWSATQVLQVAAGPSEPPDADPYYADSSYTMLQLLVEAVTREPLSGALRRDLLAPKGLGRIAMQDGAFAGGAAGITSDATDLARWGYELYGGRLLGMPAVTEMTNAPDAVLARGGASYGLGTMRFTTAFGLDAVGYLGDVDGHSGALAVVAERRMSVAVLVVGDGKNTRSFVERVVTAAHTRR